MASRKGKEVAKGKSSSGKRKHDDDKDDKAGKGRKRSNPDVSQFFDDAAYEVDDDEFDDDIDDLFNDDNFEDGFDPEILVNNVLPSRTTQLPFAPKEEELSGDELEKFLEERYKPGSGFVTYEENVYDSKRPIDGNTSLPSQREPTIWKVKCMIGRERHSVFCLMQKFMDLQPLGTKLQIISAFALDHVKGFVYVEAERQHDVHEACNGLCTMYWTRVAPVPKSEVAHLLSVRSRVSEIPVGSWARVKNGKYKGDLAQVIHVNESRKKATVKLIPRIDLQLMSEKFGGGAPSKKEVPVSGTTTRKTITPAPRLISSIELEEFLPFMQQRRDRDTGLFCYFLNGMMLKDGYLYKKVPVDSLSFSGVMPTEAELLKFESPQQEDSNNKEWLFELYGEQPKKAPTKRHDKCGGGKGEGSGSKGEASSSSCMISTFEVHDLVFFGRNDFGVVVGTSKDDSIKILKDGSEGPIVVTHDASQLKSGSFDRKFTALDNQKKILLVNDTVRVVDGSLQGRQGIVKLIYRGIVYICDENELENSGYICCKSHLCEKLKISGGKGEETEVSAFDDCPASPKTPLPTERPWEQGENNKFNRGDNEAMFTIGQSLRIKVGPLKGYLCRVLALRRSDVTVKLDSQHKILTVKCEHLTEVRGKSGAYSSSDNAEIAKPFDLLGTQNDSGDWMAGVGTSTGVGTSADGERWGAGGITTERSSWPTFGSSSLSLDPGSTSTNSQIKDAGDTSWDTKVAPAIASSWNMTASDEKIVGSSEQSGGWGKSANVGTSKVENEWNKAKDANNGPSKDAEASWGRSDTFSDKGKGILGNPGSSWGNTSSVGKNNTDTWGKESGSGGGTSSWGKSSDAGNKSTAEETSDGGAWAKPVKKDDGSAWNSSVASEPGNNAAAEEGNWKKSSTTDGGQAVQWGSTVKTNGGGASWGNSGSSSATNNKPSDVSWGKEEAKDCASNDSKSPWGSSNSAAPERQTGGWSNKPSNGGTQWGQSSKCSTDASKNQQSGWGHSQSSGNNSQVKASCWNQSSVGSGEEDLKGTTDQGGDDWINKKKAGGGQESSWGKKTSSDSDKQDSGWGNKRSWDSGNQDSGWGNKRSCDSGNQDSGWATKKSWDSGNSFGGNENQSADMDGDGGQRGGRRGGYRGGRGGSDRGGYRGGRGGFGGRGGGSNFGDGESGGRGGGWRGGYRGRGGRGRGGDEDGGGGGGGFGQWGGSSGSSSGWSASVGGDNKDLSSGGGGWKSGSESGGGGGWKSGNESGGGGGGGWKSGNEGGGGGWKSGNEGGGGGGGWKSGNEGGGGGGGSWKSGNEGGGGGWKSGNEGGGGGSWKSGNEGGGGGWKSGNEGGGGGSWKSGNGGSNFGDGESGGGRRGGWRGRGGYRGRGGRGRGGDEDGGGGWKSGNEGGGAGGWKSGNEGGGSEKGGWGGSSSSNSSAGWSTWGDKKTGDVTTSGDAGAAAATTSGGGWNKEGAAAASGWNNNAASAAATDGKMGWGGGNGSGHWNKTNEGAEGGGGGTWGNKASSSAGGGWGEKAKVASAGGWGEKANATSSAGAGGGGGWGDKANAASARAAGGGGGWGEKANAASARAGGGGGGWGEKAKDSTSSASGWGEKTNNSASVGAGARGGGGWGEKSNAASSAGAGSGGGWGEKAKDAASSAGGGGGGGWGEKAKDAASSAGGGGWGEKAKDAASSAGGGGGGGWGEKAKDAASSAGGGGGGGWGEKPQVAASSSGWNNNDATKSQEGGNSSSNDPWGKPTPTNDNSWGAKKGGGW